MKKFLLSLLSLICVLSVSATSFTLVKSADQLVAGKNYIIVAAESNYAMSTTQNSNNRGQLPITKNGEIISVSTEIGFTESVQVLTLEQGSIDGTWAFYAPSSIPEESGYLYAAGGTNNNNYLRTKSNKDEVASAIITVSTEGIAAIVFQGGVLRNTLKHNSTSSLFSCYASGQKDVSLYVETESSGNEPVVETVATPVISPASGEITADTEISIECATEDATIKYTIDGTEPSAENGTEYIEPFTLNADATVKAIAIKDGYNNSAVATATYTLFVSSEYSYELVTSVENGGHYIIVGEKDGNYFAMGEQKDNNRAAVAVECTDNTIANPSVKVCEFELQGSDGAWAFYTGDGYLYAASSSKNYLRTETTLSNNSSATIEIDGTTGVATIKFTSDYTRNWMRYNSQSGLFSCYTSGQQDIYLYQREGDVPTGIEDTMVDENAPVEYYNLQGVKVANPENGIFIKKQGAKATKVVL